MKTGFSETILPDTDLPMTVAVLVDALRPAYVRPSHMPYLCALSQESAVGVLRECFGFVAARPAYFGGLTPELYGYTNMYCFDQESSPFTIARALPTFPMSSSEAAELRDFVDQVSRERLSPFAKAYANSIDIPLEYLPYFNIVENHAPWERQADYRSIFTIFNEKGISCTHYSWPETNLMSDSSDKAIVQSVLKECQPDNRFIYIHLQELDSKGHQYGPDSDILLAGLRETDRICQELIENIQSRYGRINVVLFGDHGMVNVTRTLDIADILSRTRLQFGVDYVYFLDSTMVRFWFFHIRARKTIEKVLAEIEGGHLLSEDEMDRQGIPRNNPQNGELFFLADPGVLIFPNFFQSKGPAAKGMHGYDPDCMDNLGFLLVHKVDSTNKENLGKIDAQALFPLFLELSGISSGEYTHIKVPEAFEVSTQTNQYTLNPNSNADIVVSEHLRQILETIERQVGAVDAVVLTGSFGRGEGGVFQDEKGYFRPVNDYDLIVVDSRDLNLALEGLGDELAVTLNIDFVDIAYSNGDWSQLPPTLFNYDLKYGSKVISGDVELLDRIPIFSSTLIPVYESVKLLLNRCAGLLSGLQESYLDGCSLGIDQQRYLTNQIVKAWVAVGDFYLLKWKGYDTSYVIRRKRFSSIAPGAGLMKEVIDQIVQAYALKCQPEYSSSACSDAEVRKLVLAITNTLIEAINMLTGAFSPTLVSALDAYLRHQSIDVDGVCFDNRICQSQLALKCTWSIRQQNTISLRHLIFAVIPCLLEVVIPERSADAFLCAQQQLNLGFIFPAATEFSPAAWEKIRFDVVAAWFAVCH